MNGEEKSGSSPVDGKSIVEYVNCGGQVFEKKSILTNNAELVGNSVAVEKRQLLGE